jgi:phage shock protein A
MKRFLKWLSGLFNVFMDKVEDPMIMIDQAKRDMQESLVHNRELAVQALTQKNNLAAMVKAAESQVEKNKAQAGMALKQRESYAQGTPQYDNAQKLALQFAGEMQNNQAQLANLQASYEQADAACVNVKKACDRQEADFRKKLGEAAAMKANYKSAQVQNAIQKALSEFNFENINEGFGAAGEKIQNMQSEAAARTEMQNSSLAGKVAELEDASHDFEAQNALSDLEKQLGFAPTTVQTTAAPQTVSVGTGGTPGGALSDLTQRLNQ